MRQALDSDNAYNNFLGTMAVPSATNAHHLILKAEEIDTPLGPMVAISDASHLYLLEFTDRRNLDKQIERTKKQLNSLIVPGHTPIISQIKKELSAYFDGKLKAFKTPIILNGTDFQKSVWRSLQSIPYGETRSYGLQAKALNNPKAVRAVARTNGLNQLAIIVPCHRVIGSNGALTGYAGGLIRKKWLLDHEQNHSAIAAV